MALFPVATIKIQKAGLVPQSGQATFYVFPLADQVNASVSVVSQCVVEFSTTVAATGAVATFEIANLHPKVVRQMAKDGYVVIEAGYKDQAANRRAPQVIFFGRLDTYRHRLSSGSIRWTFTANAFPLEVWGLPPRAAQPVSTDGKPVAITIGEAIRIIADRIGIGRANVRMPKIFDGDLADTDLTRLPNLPSKFSESFRNAITLATWSTTKSAIEELQDLMQRVSVAVKETFHVVRNYSLLPNVNNPFIVVIDDVNRFSGEFLNLDLDSPQIIEAGPGESTAVTPTTPAATEQADEGGEAEPPAATVQIATYEVTSVFDPLISGGIVVNGRSRKYDLNPKFKVTKGKHQLNGSPLRWRTEYAGEVQADVEVARVS